MNHKKVWISLKKMITVAFFALLLSIADFETLNFKTVIILIITGFGLFCLGWYFSRKYYSNQDYIYHSNYRTAPDKPWWEDR